MAKRKKIEEETELFKEPEFDEREFLVSELKKGKGIILVFVIAAVLGIFSAYLQVNVDTYLAYLVGIATIFALKPALKAINAEFKDKKTWTFAILAFIILWIAFWSVGLNPPFNDVSPPQIRMVEVYTGASANATWVLIYDYAANYNKELAKEIAKNKESLNWNNITKIRALVTDNVGVSTVYINGKEATADGNYYVVNALNIGSEITITATDVNGHRNTMSISVPTGT